MSSDLRPIHALDIHAPDDVRPAAALTATPPDEAAYRWLHFDLADPALEEWCLAHLPRFAARTLLAARTRPRVDEAEDGLVLTLRGINLNQGEEMADMVSLRLWVTPRLVVTVRRARVFAMEDLAADMRSGNAPATTCRLITRVAENLVDRIERLSVDLEDRADDFEDAVYEEGAHALPGLAPLHRSVIKLRRHIGPVADAIRDLARIESDVVSRDLRNRLRDTANRAQRSVEEVAEVRDRLQTLTRHLDMANDARLGRHGFLLTALATIFVPLSFVTGLFGVNLAGIPGAAHPHAFPILTLSMIVFAALALLFFRWRKWL